MRRSRTKEETNRTKVSEGGMARTPRIHPAYRSYFLGSVVSAASWSRSPVFHTFTPVSLARGAAATEGSREPCNECSEGSGDHQKRVNGVDYVGNGRRHVSNERPFTSRFCCCRSGRSPHLPPFPSLSPTLPVPAGGPPSEGRRERT